MKRIFVLFLAAATLLGLCACGEGGPSSGAPVLVDPADLAEPAQSYTSAPLTLPAAVTDIAAVTVLDGIITICGGDGALYQLDADGTLLGTFRMAVENGAVTDMTADGDGALWLVTAPQPSLAQPASAVCRFDPDRGQVLDSFTLPLTGGAAAVSIRADAARQRLYVTDGAGLLALDYGGKELFRLSEPIHDLTVAGDGTVCALGAQMDTLALLTLAPDGDRWETALRFDTQDVTLAGGGDGILAAVDGTLCRLDLAGRALTPLLDLTLTNTTMLADVFALDGERFLLYDRFGPTLYLARPGADGGPVTVTAAVFGPGVLTPAVVAFNNSQDEYRVVLKDYSEYDDVSQGFYATGGLERLGLDIAAGDGPDILALDTLPVYQYVRDGLLEDLYPYIDGDPDLGRDALDGGILAAMETDGALYELAPVVQLTALAAAPGALDDPARTTWQGILAALGEDAFAGGEGEGLLISAVCGDGSPFIDWEGSTCDFENDEFLALLTLARGAARSDPGASPAAARCTLFGGAGLIPVCQTLGLEGQTPLLAGTPGRDGPRILLSPVIDLGICAQSPHKDGAWAFLRTLLTDPSGLWLGRFLALGHETDPAALGASTDAVPSERLEALDAAVDGAFAAANGTAHRDMAIAAILREQAAPYFAGQTDAQATAADIQSRVSLYLAEHS